MLTHMTSWVAFIWLISLMSTPLPTVVKKRRILGPEWIGAFNLKDWIWINIWNSVSIIENWCLSIILIWYHHFFRETIHEQQPAHSSPRDEFIPLQEPRERGRQEVIHDATVLPIQVVWDITHFRSSCTSPNLRRHSHRRHGRSWGETTHLFVVNVVLNSLNFWFQFHGGCTLKFNSEWKNIYVMFFTRLSFRYLDTIDTSPIVVQDKDGDFGDSVFLGGWHASLGVNLGVILLNWNKNRIFFTR